MSAVEGRTCAVCGHVAESTMEHSVHVTLEHPELNRQARRERQATATPSPAARPVSCWRCAADVNAKTLVCGSCGWEHPAAPGARPSAVVLFPEERTPLMVADLDHRGRPR